MIDSFEEQRWCNSVVRCQKDAPEQIFGHRWTSSEVWPLCQFLVVTLEVRPRIFRSSISIWNRNYSEHNEYIIFIVNWSNPEALPVFTKQFMKQLRFIHKDVNELYENALKHPDEQIRLELQKWRL